MRDDLAVGRQKYLIASCCKELQIENPLVSTATVDQAHRLLRELKKELRRKNGNRK
jgi:hypothetical protein